MLNISLDYVNQHSPYHVSESEEDSFIFETDEGIIYEAGFIQDSMLGIEDVYQFFIMPKKEIVGQRKDNKIAHTISALLEAFFLDSNVLLDYICDTSDGRQKARSRLFAHWFLLNPQHNNFVQHSFSLVFEDESYFAAIIFRSDSPRYSECLKAIENFEDNIRGKLNPH